jgi:predicted ArsR family transcriptional regulator
MYLRLQSSVHSLDYLLGWLIAGTRGGPNRARIIEALKQSSFNTNQLAAFLKISYKTAKEHLEVLEKNKIVIGVYDRGATAYFLSQTMQENYLTFEKLLKKIDERSNSTRQTSVANELEMREIKIGFRQNHSICKQFRVGTGVDFEKDFSDLIKPLTAEAYLAETTGVYSLTSKGKTFIKDTVDTLRYRETEL